MEEILPKNEKEATKAIIPRLKQYGWLCIRMQQNIGSHPGISDYVCLKHGIIIFLEIKGPNGKQNPKQIKFDEDVTRAGGAYILAKKFDDIIEFFADDPGAFDFVTEKFNEE